MSERKACQRCGELLCVSCDTCTGCACGQCSNCEAAASHDATCSAHANTARIDSNKWQSDWPTEGTWWAWHPSYSDVRIVNAIPYSPSGVIFRAIGATRYRWQNDPDDNDGLWRFQKIEVPAPPKE